jgi:hypothetical protein
MNNLNSHSSIHPSHPKEKLAIAMQRDAATCIAIISIIQNKFFVSSSAFAASLPNDASLLAPTQVDAS